MKIFQKSGCTDCPKDHWNANGNDHACKPCPGSESVGAGLGKAESDCSEYILIIFIHNPLPRDNTNSPIKKLV